MCEEIGTCSRILLQIILQISAPLFRKRGRGDRVLVKGMAKRRVNDDIDISQWGEGQVLSGERLSEQVRQFVLAHVDSVGHLEALLFLARHDDRPWSSAAVSRELRGSPDSTQGQMMSLRGHGLLKEVTDGQFIYQPDTPALDEAARATFAAYAELKVTVISLIYSKPIERIRDLADAFKVRRDK